MIASIDTSLIILLVVVGVLQLTLLVWALVDLIRRPQTSALPRWAWVVIVLFANFLGPILYLLIGRTPPQLVDDRRLHTADPPAPPDNGRSIDPSPGPSKTERAIDAVYGRDDTDA
jgi:hypothetical protein